MRGMMALGPRGRRSPTIWLPPMPTPPTARALGLLVAAGGMLVAACALMIAFAALAILGRWLVLGWCWALLPLQLPPVVTSALGLGLACMTAWGAWSLVQRLFRYRLEA